MNNNNNTSLHPLTEALGAIPDDEKVEYLQALRVAPLLVERDSDPTAFLRFCNGNTTAAARRIVVYWRKRVEVFGPVRAFLPLIENGALESDEIEILQSGAYWLLPNDTQGRVVGFGDRSSLPDRFQNGHDDVKLRVIFFLFQQMFLRATRSDYACVLVIRGPHVYSQTTRDNVTIRAREFLLQGFPLRLQAFHMVYFRREQKSLLEVLAPFLMDHLGRFVFNLVVIHNCNSKEQALESLIRHGFSPESLPSCMGGMVGTYGVAAAAAARPSVYDTSAGPLTNKAVAIEHTQQRKQSPEMKQSSVEEPVIMKHPFSGLDSVDFQGLDLSGDGSSAAAALGFEHIGVELQPALQLQQQGMSMVRSVNQAPDSSSNDPLFDMLDFGTSESGSFPFDASPQLQPREGFTSSSAATLFNEVPDFGGGFGLEEGALLDARPVHAQTPPQQQQQQPRRQVLGASSSVPTSVRGATNSPNSDSDAPFTDLIKALKELPAVDRTALEEALQRAPVIVKTESNPTRYLRFEKFKAGAAAQRLALYWKHRVHYFGDKAFLPLTQTRDGALWEEDLQTLNAGSFVFFPTDSGGQPVLFFDPSKRPENVSGASLVRVAFYFFSILCCEYYPVVMMEGCMFLVWVPSTTIPELSQYFDMNVRKVTQIALDSFPVQKCDTHVIYSPSSSPTDNSSSLAESFTEFVLPVLLRALGRLLIHDQAHFHICHTRDELGRKLVHCGLSGVVVQAAMRGGISDNEFAQWVVERQRLEQLKCSQQAQLQRQQRKPAQHPPVAVAAAAAAAEGSADRIGQKITEPSETEGDDGVANAKDIISAMELVSVSEKKAYLEALQRVPDLIEKESNPTWFLKAESYNSLAAAKLLAAYWRIRCEVFQERAFLPMDQTSDGALDRKDVVILQSGFLTQLPTDAAGCSVICCDGTHLKQKSPSLSSQLLRIFFYMWSVAVSPNDISRKDGYSVLYLMTSQDPSFDRACRDSLDLVIEAHPVKLKCFHLLVCSSVGRGAGVSEEDLHHGRVKKMLKLLDSSVHEKITTHVCSSPSEFANKLIGYGMAQDGLPRAFGGKWTLSDFLLWQELRVRCEWDLPIPAASRQVAERYVIMSTARPPPSRLTAEAKADRQRRLNAIHSRRKRDRIRVDLQMLQEQCTILEEEKRRLLQEGRELEELLHRAEVIVKEELTTSGRIS